MPASKDPGPQKAEKRKKWSAPRLRLLGNTAEAVPCDNKQERQALSQELRIYCVNLADEDEKHRAARQWLDAYVAWLTVNRSGPRQTT